MDKRVLTQHVFVTLTYRREGTEIDSWKSVSKDFNRFIQRWRRFQTGIHYLRTVEAHQDLYCHIHCLAQLKHGVFVTDSRWFDDKLYQKWRGLWTLGHSDFQAPKTDRRNSLLYIVKYISKTHTLKTLWKHIFAHTTAVSNQTPTIQQCKNTSNHTTAQNATMTDLQSAQFQLINNPTLFFCKQFKVKQCTWSRGFKFPTYERIPFVEPPQQKLN